MGLSVISCVGGHNLRLLVAWLTALLRALIRALLPEWQEAKALT
jgi:hypothetical protein